MMFVALLKRTLKREHRTGHPYKVISVETNAINSISSNDNNRTYYKANGVKANEYTKGIVVIKDNNRTKVIVKE